METKDQSLQLDLVHAVLRDAGFSVTRMVGMVAVTLKSRRVGAWELMAALESAELEELVNVCVTSGRTFVTV